MKIKKIEWKHDGSGTYDTYNAMLTTGQDAKVVAVCQGTEYYDEQWSWEIDTESRGGACGVAKTKELAMEACQAAWEKMVMEALDDDGCEHCKNGEVIYDDKGLVLGLDAGALDVTYPQEYGGPCYDSVDINYCPMCGRKL